MTLSSNAVERVEIFVGGFSAIAFQIVPVEMVVVDKGSVEDHSAVWLEGAGNYVGRVGMSAAVSRRAEAALGIGFYNEASEVWDAAVDFVDLFAPPLGDPRIQRVKDRKSVV